jgi:hypothetical protein
MSANEFHPMNANELRPREELQEIAARKKAASAAAGTSK